MAFFGTTQLKWSEPWFFVIRLREAQGWVRRGLLALGLAVVVLIIIYFIRGQAFDLVKELGISALSGVVLVLLLDMGLIQREITISEDRISFEGVIGNMEGGSFALKDIKQAQLRTPEEWRKRHASLLLDFGESGFLIGVPQKTSLESIANVLHRLGVEVELTGWEPSETDTRVQVVDEVVLSKEAAEFSREARIWTVDEHEARLEPPSVMAVAITIALGPLVISLLGTIGGVGYLISQWSVLETFDKVLIGGSAVGALIVSVLYMILIGAPLASRYGISAAKKLIHTRPNALFDPEDEQLMTVEIFDRSAWTTTVVISGDFGFLEIDKSRRTLRLEGNKNRWDIPATALTTCRIEEAKVGTEGTESPDKRYYVVISLDHEGETWEAGMVPTRTNLGNDTNDMKYARAQELLGRISEVVEQG